MQIDEDLQKAIVSAWDLEQEIRSLSEYIKLFGDDVTPSEVAESLDSIVSVTHLRFVHLWETYKKANYEH